LIAALVEFHEIPGERATPDTNHGLGGVIAASSAWGIARREDEKK